MTTQFNADDITQLNASATQITARTAFTDGLGGYHSAVSDGLLNASYPRVAGGTRAYTYQNLQQLQADLTAANTALTAMTTTLATIVSDLADVKAAMDQITAGPSDPTNVITPAVRYAVAHP